MKALNECSYFIIRKRFINFINKINEKVEATVLKVI